MTTAMVSAASLRSTSAVLRSHTALVPSVPGRTFPPALSQGARTPAVLVSVHVRGEVPVVALDKSGNTGDNLLDDAQPICSLAAGTSMGVSGSNR